MALRRNLRRHRSGPVMKILKAAMLVLFLLALAVTGLIMYFNGQHVKDPLLNLLSERSGLDVDLGQVEFSPLYPDTIKLHHVRFNQSTIGELYVEYDLKSVLAGQDLVVNDLYLKDAALNSEDIETLKSGKLGFAHVNIRSLRAKHVPIETLSLSARDASFELNDVDIRNDQVKIAHGSGELYDGLLNGISFKTISGAFVSDGRSVNIRDLNCDILGGTVSGAVEYVPDTRRLNFSALRAEKLLLKNPARLLQKYAVTAPAATLSHLTVVLDDSDLLLSDISGSVSALSLTGDNLSFLFQGTVDEISKPAMQLTAERNHASLQCRNRTLDINLSGSIFEGKYELDAQTDLENRAITLNRMNLADGKLEITRSLYEGLKGITAGSNIRVNDLSVKNTSLLSHLDFLPLSARTLSGAVAGFRFSAAGVVPAPAGLVSLDAEDILYSDLRVNRLSLTSSLNNDGIMLTVPKVTFGKSTANLTLSLSKDAGQSFLLAQAHDFELSSLNSSLIPHLMSGKVNFDADLKSRGSTSDLMKNLSGTLSISGDGILISALGLDLINGGKKENFRLDRTQLLTALADSDCGLHDLKAQTKFSGGSGRYAVSAKLATSAMELSGSINLKNSDVSGRALFVSLPKDSVTVVKLSGPLKSPLFEINAVDRGIVRPGLFVKQLSDEELEKQRKEREEMLVNQEQDTQKLLDAVEELKQQINVLERDNADLERDTAKLQHDSAQIQAETVATGEPQADPAAESAAGQTQDAEGAETAPSDDVTPGREE